MVRTKVLVVFTLFFLFSSFCLAEMGCFTNSDSPYYCSDISREIAQEECSLYNCELEKSFFSSKSCSSEEMLNECGIIDFQNKEEVKSNLSIEKSQTELDEKKGNSAFAIFGMILLIPILLFILLYFLRNDNILSTFSSKKQKKEELNVIPKRRWLSPNLSNPRLKEKQKRWNLKHKHQLAKFHREEMLSEFGEIKELKVTEEFRKIKGLIRHYKKKKKQIIKQEKPNHFEKLEELSRTIKEKEKKIVRDYQNIDPGLIKKQKLDKLLTELRQIGEGK